MNEEKNMVQPRKVANLSSFAPLDLHHSLVYSPHGGDDF